MRVNRYVGKSLPDAMRQVEADLGRDAVILRVRDGTRSGLWKLLGKGRAEIVAGSGFRIVGQNAERPPAPRPAGGHRNAAAARAYGAAAPGAGPDEPRTPDVPAPNASRRGPPRADGPPAPRPRADDLRPEVLDLKLLVAEVQKLVLHHRLEGLPAELFEEYLGLTTSRLSEALAHKVVRNLQERLKPEAMRDPRVIREALRATLEQMIPTSGPIRLERGRTRRIALIGPTGVGKTTTIAKLAGHYAVRQRRRVALLTNDTYRIAASDQLRKIAEIMNERNIDIPFRVVPDGASARAALESLADRDLVLIDTAGRGQRDPRKMDELRAFLEAVRPDETHLVVSLTTHPDTLADVVERFSSYPVDHLLVTKLDEAAQFGLLLDVLVKVRKTLSYVTTGQSIPDDIQPADAGRLAELVLSGRPDGGA